MVVLVSASKPLTLLLLPRRSRVVLGHPLLGRLLLLLLLPSPVETVARGGEPLLQELGLEVLFLL